MEYLRVIGGIVSLLGSLFLLLSSIGLLRMPDVYNRMQAGTKATTLGSILFLIGIGIANPAWFGKIVLLIIFVILTNPISSHVLARAAHKSGIPLAEKSVGDALDNDNLQTETALHFETSASTNTQTSAETQKSKPSSDSSIKGGHS